MHMFVAAMLFKQFLQLIAAPFEDKQRVARPGVAGAVAHAIAVNKSLLNAGLGWQRCAAHPTYTSQMEIMTHIQPADRR